METHHADFSAFASIYVRVYVKKEKKKRKEKKKKEYNLLNRVYFLFSIFLMKPHPSRKQNKTANEIPAGFSPSNDNCFAFNRDLILA